GRLFPRGMTEIAGSLPVLRHLGRHRPTGKGSGSFPDAARSGCPRAGFEGTARPFDPNHRAGRGSHAVLYAQTATTALEQRLRNEEAEPEAAQFVVLVIPLAA